MPGVRAIVIAGGRELVDADGATHRKNGETSLTKPAMQPDRKWV
jgi:hypothetical protein